MARNCWGGLLIALDKTRLFIKEVFIQKIEYDHEKGFDFVISDITKFFLTKKFSCRQYIMDNREFDKIETYFNSLDMSNKGLLFLRKLKLFIKQENYIKCLCHGDMHYNNILFDGKKYYYIDFERVGEHFFLYDILSWIYCESYYFGNDLLLNNYLNGKYDRQIREIFNLNKIAYDPRLKGIYMFIMLYERFGLQMPIKFIKYILDF